MAPKARSKFGAPMCIIGIARMGAKGPWLPLNFQNIQSLCVLRGVFPNKIVLFA